MLTQFSEQNLKFTKQVLTWFKRHGRHDLPWQRQPTAYRVWVSEIMLQQTQVTTVIDYFQKFMRRFPSLKSLALADQDEVLAHWSGLGYYARARNLQKAAQVIYQQHRGRFPKTVTALCELPGIGRSTAGAIVSLALNQPASILDGNVKRVLARHFAIEGYPGDSAISKMLWAFAEDLTPAKQCRDYNQAMMDLGATICTRKPQCDACPLQKSCLAYKNDLTTIIPGKKAKSRRPVKKINMLIITDKKQNILLIKRAPTGIWGGLWSFPEYSEAINPSKWAQKNLGLKLKAVLELEELRHQFSHFELIIQPKLMQIIATNKATELADFHWHHKTKPLPGGIPAPINKLLNELARRV
ncbi:MAG: A/G-specific adenine glycosylase [Gammaproteobacteria bacterium]|nr:A/G-specific adenine glycosylase [Gammaproteobacteria bacterium]